MNMSDVFQSVHKQLRIEDLVKFTEETYIEDSVDKCSYGEWVKYVEELGYDVEKIYVDENSRYRSRYYYVGDYFTASLFLLERSFLSSDMGLRALKFEEHYKKLFHGENYGMYFLPEGNQFTIDYFVRKYEEIPENKRFEAFSDLYIMIENGFTNFPTHIMNEVFRLAPREESQNQLRENYDVNGDTLTIFRGVVSKSTPLEKTISWTMSKDVAEWYANRFEKGDVYSAEVAVEDVIYYINDREEEEVWVQHKDIWNITKIG